MAILRLSTGESVSKYCKRMGIPYNCVWNRIEEGWDVDSAATTPFGNKNGTKYFINGKSARSQMTTNEYQQYLKKLRKETK